MPEPTSPNPDQPDGGEGTSGAPDGDKNKPDMISRAEADRAFRSRDAERDKRIKLEKDFDAYKADTATQIGTLESRLREIEDGKNAADEEAAKKAGDIERLTKNWDGKRTELEKQLEAERTGRAKDVGDWQGKHDSLATKLHKNFVERTLLEELTGLSTHPKGELVFFQKDFQFEIVEDDDGNFTGIKAKDSDKSIAELHKEICEKYGLPFEKNDRANGSGAQQNANNAANGAVRLPANFASKTKEEQQKWFADNPTYRPG